MTASSPAQDSNCILEFLLEVIPSLDWTTDLAVAVFGLYFSIRDDGPIYVTGFSLFWLSQLIRIYCVFTTHVEHPVVVDLDESCGAVVFFLMMVPWFLVKTLLDLFKFCLLPIDLVLSLAYNEPKVAVIADSGFFLTESSGFPESKYYKSLSFLGKYWNLFQSITLGGRWVAFKLVKFHEPQVQLGRVSEDAYVIARLAIAEEVIENIGGILMSVALLIRDWHYLVGIINGMYEAGDPQAIFLYVSIVSLALNVCDACLETFGLGKILKYLDDSDRPGRNAEDDWDEES